MLAPVALAVVGHNNPPEETSIDRAKPTMAELAKWLKDNPVISTEEESRAAKDLLDRVGLHFKLMETDRDSKVRPLNDEVKAINAAYFAFHNPDKKRPALWDKQANEVWAKMTSYARELERQRWLAEEAARRVAEAAAEEARRAAEAAAQAREEAAMGVCDVDLAAAIEEERDASQAAIAANWTAQRAEKDTKVRITGGIGNAVSLKDKEVLGVSDWKAAIEEMCDDSGNPPKDIADAILKCARAYRKVFDELPSGISVSYERSL